MKKIKKKALLLGLALSVLTACGKQGKKSETEVQGTTNAVSEGATEATTEKGTEKAAAKKPEKQVMEGTVS
ncbi:MAG: transglutaminase, partial [Oribacterium parvum]|nr:transglutaminase [Oribacterium parvum]